MRISAPAAVSTALWATAALGQSSFIGQSDQLDWNERATTGDLQRFAECAVKRHSKDASLLVLDTSQTAIRKEYYGVFDADCLGPTLRGLKIPNFEARFAIAYALVRSTLSNLGPEELPKAAPLSLPVVDAASYTPKSKKPSKKELVKSQENLARAQSLVALLAFGECVVRANPQQSRAVLFAKPNSVEDARAFDALMPALSGCLNKGREFRVDKASMRGSLAVNYYRLAMAPKLSAPTTVTKQ